MLDAPAFFVKSTSPEEQTEQVKTLVQNREIRNKWIIVWGKQVESLMLCRRLKLAVNFPEGLGLSTREQKKLPKPRGIALKDNTGSLYVHYDRKEKPKKRTRINHL